MTAAVLERPCLARGDLVHDGPCTCLGARDGDPARFPTPTLRGPR